MAELMIIECQNCGNSFKGDISQPFICPKCREKNVHVADSRHTSLLKKALSDEEKAEINNVEEQEESSKNVEKKAEEKKNIETITNFNQPNIIEAIKQAQGKTEETKVSKAVENPVQAQINKILEDAELAKKEKEKVAQSVVSGNLDNSVISEIMKRLNKLDMEYSIIEALLKEILSRLSNN